MEKKLLKILEECNANRIDTETAKEQVLDLFDVRKRIVVSPEKVIKTKPIMIKEGWGNLFG